MRRSRLETACIYAGIALLLAFLLAPFVEAAKVSVSPLDHLLSSPYRLVPEDATLAAYRTMWTDVPLLGAYIVNSILIATACTLITLVLAVPAAYALARLQFPGRRVLLVATLAVNMVSGAVLLVPLYRMLRVLHLLNSYAAIVLPCAAFLLPTAIWLLVPYFRAIPRELEEAASIDGASSLATIGRVVLPLAAPGLVVVAATSFIGAYAQQFLVALTFASDDRIMPISVGLFQFFGRFQVAWNELMAASIVSVLPVLAAFALLQGRIVAGLTEGAVKG